MAATHLVCNCHSSRHQAHHTHHSVKTNLIKELFAKMASLCEDFRDCSICMIAFRDPKVLPCGHTFCSPCIGQMTNLHGYTKCPRCNKNYHVNQARPDHRFNAFLSALAEQNAEIQTLRNEVEAKDTVMQVMHAELKGNNVIGFKYE